jgi:hypothetical protein
VSGDDGGKDRTNIKNASLMRTGRARSGGAFLLQPTGEKMKFKVKIQHAFDAWYLIPTIRFMLYSDKSGGFITLLWLRGEILFGVEIPK